jgi:hypothetical protein
VGAGNAQLFDATKQAACSALHRGTVSARFCVSRFERSTNKR